MFYFEDWDVSFCAISGRGGDEVVDCPDGPFPSLFKPFNPMFTFCIMDHLGIFVPDFMVFLMYGVFKVVEYNLAVCFSC